MQTIKNQGGRILFLLVVAGALVTGCRPPGARALWKGRELLEQGKYELALAQLRAAVNLLPTNAHAYNYLGLALHHCGQAEQAERAYYRALTLNHELVEARYNLGCLFLEENKVEQAKSELAAFTLRRSDNAEGWLKLGTAQLRSRDPLAAERSFNQAFRLNPKDPESLTGIGVARWQRKRPLEAVQAFNNALRLQPDYALALMNLAIVTQEDLKDKQLALQHYRRYLELKPPREDSAAVQKVVRQLEQELAERAAPPAPAVTVTTQKTSSAAPVKVAQAEPATRTTAPPPALVPAPVPKRFATNPITPAATAGVATAAAPTKSQPAKEPIKVSAPTNEPRPQPVSIPAKPVELAEAPKAAPVRVSPPAPPLEVVNVPARPVFKPAQDVPLRPASTSTPASAAPAKPPAQPAAASTPAKPAKRSFLSRINPVRIFSGSRTETRATPQPTASSSAVAAKPSAPEISWPLPEQPAGTFERYKYVSPSKPAPGERTAAERAYAQGVQAEQAQHLPEAIQAYRRATQLDPAYFDAYYNLGVVMVEDGKLQSALATYEYALALRPESLDARYNFALALKQASFPVEARNEFQKLLAVYPKEGRAHLALGNLYAQQFRDPARAREHYLKVLEYDPRNPQAAAVRYWLADNPAP